VSVLGVYAYGFACAIGGFWAGMMWVDRGR
jgi:hypothetical protein